MQLLSMGSVLGCALLLPAMAASGERIKGIRLRADQVGPGTVRTFAEIKAVDEALRAARLRATSTDDRAGHWVVQRLGGAAPHRRNRVLVNGNGDLQMGIRFPEPVRLHGALLRAVGTPGAGASAIHVVGYRAGNEVGRSDWLGPLDTAPVWFDIPLPTVDRIRIEACGGNSRGVWYAIDDLTYAPTNAAEPDSEPMQLTVVDFEDRGHKEVLNETRYQGLVWERGAGVFPVDQSVIGPFPQDEPNPAADDDNTSKVDRSIERGQGMIDIRLEQNYETIVRGDPFTGFPPDTQGAVGPNHVVVAVNNVVGIYDKETGDEIGRLALGSLQPGSNGDPELVYDTFSNRWILVSTDFIARLFLSISLTDDPTGSWFSTSFNAELDEPPNVWPDFPKLGVDEDGIYISYSLVNAAFTDQPLFAIEKAPLLDSAPAMGAVTGFSIPFLEAFSTNQPMVVLDDSAPAGHLLVSRNGLDRLGISRVNPPITDPTFEFLGQIDAPTKTGQARAEQLDGPDVSTLASRMSGAVLRDGHIWTTMTTASDEFTFIRWYRIDPATMTLVQDGTVEDGIRHYYYGSIAVNRNNDIMIGCSGSNAGQFIGAYFTGRAATELQLDLGPPTEFRSGESTIQNLDQFGRNRWGDYSATVVDPFDDLTFWTFQAYADQFGLWGVQVGRIRVNDCNANGINDECDLSCDGCGNPGCGQSLDCNANGVPDECEPDCNTNAVPDECDIASGAALDCNGNGVPDECDVAQDDADCNANAVPDECDIASGFSIDCNANGQPDSCDLANGTAADCNANAVPDSCDIAVGTAADCNANGVPDTCDIASGVAVDCNQNGIPDSCDVARRFEARSPLLSPIGAGNPQQHVFTDVPEAIDTVRIEVQARGDFNFTSESLRVTFNGQLLGDLLTSGFRDCPPADTPDVDVLSLEPGTFNALRSAGEGNAMFVLETTAGVDAGLCDAPASFVQLVLKYDDGVTGSRDENQNGIPDECESGLPGDMNCDGTVSVSDIGGFVLALTDPTGYEKQFPDCRLLNGDLNSDGAVSVSDIGPFVELLTGP